MDSGRVGLGGLLCGLEMMSKKSKCEHSFFSSKAGRGFECRHCHQFRWEISHDPDCEHEWQQTAEALDGEYKEFRCEKCSKTKSECMHKFVFDPTKDWSKCEGCGMIIKRESPVIKPEKFEIAVRDLVALVNGALNDTKSGFFVEINDLIRNALITRANEVKSFLGDKQPTQIELDKLRELFKADHIPNIPWHQMDPGGGVLEA